MRTTWKRALAAGLPPTDPACAAPGASVDGDPGLGTTHGPLGPVVPQATYSLSMSGLAEPAIGVVERVRVRFRAEWLLVALIAAAAVYLALVPLGFLAWRTFFEGGSFSSTASATPTTRSGCRAGGELTRVRDRVDRARRRRSARRSRTSSSARTSPGSRSSSPWRSCRSPFRASSTRLPGSSSPAPGPGRSTPCSSRSSARRRSTSSASAAWCSSRRCASSRSSSCSCMRDSAPSTPPSRNPPSSAALGRSRSCGG